MVKLLKMSLEKDLLVRRLRKETLLEVENRKVVWQVRRLAARITTEINAL
jgi:hypothetical protein